MILQITYSGTADIINTHYIIHPSTKTNDFYVSNTQISMKHIFDIELNIILGTATKMISNNKSFIQLSHSQINQY